MERCKDSFPGGLWDDDPTVVEEESVHVLNGHGVPLASVVLSGVILGEVLQGLPVPQNVSTQSQQPWGSVMGGIQSPLLPYFLIPRIQFGY